MLLSSQKPSMFLGRITGMRWWMGLSNSFAEVVTMAHVGIELSLGVLPHGPYAREGERFCRPHGDADGALAGPGALPLVEAVGED